MGNHLGRVLVCVAVLAVLDTAGASASPIYSSVVLADNPAGYWRLGETPAQTTAFDSSPFGRNGTYNGAVTRGVPGAIVGDPNTAAAFAGGFVSIPGGPFNFANSFSLEAWVINNNTVLGRIIANGQPGAVGYGLGILGDGRLRFTTYGVLDYDSNVVVPRDGNFHHVVVTLDAGNDANFYLDGVLRQTVLGTLPARSSASPLTIGRNPAGVLEPFNGTIDEVAVYNSVLSAAQVQNHFLAGISSAEIPEPASVMVLGLGVLGLVGYGRRRRGRSGSAGSVAS